MGLAAMATTARGMAATVRVLGRGELGRFTGGDRSEVARFESELAGFLGTSHALAVNSGTSALVAALVGAGVGPGDEVLVPAYTWVSTAAAALAVGAVPVLVEVDASLTMDPADLKDRITPRSRAVLPVHMLNHVADMDAIMDVAAAHDLVVIEDACQAIGVTYRGARPGRSATPAPSASTSTRTSAPARAAPWSPGTRSCSSGRRCTTTWAATNAPDSPGPTRT